MSTTSSTTSTTTTGSSTSTSSSTSTQTSSTTSSSTTSSTSSTTSTTTTSGGSTGLSCSTAVRDLTAQVTMLTYQNDGTDAMVCQILAVFGDGADDLDGTGGNFELTLMLGGYTNQPDPQLVTFGTAAQASIFTEPFVLPVGETVTAKIKSPNAADTAVYVHCCIYEVGVESIRDELEALQAALTGVQVSLRSVRNIYDTSAGGGGVYPFTTGTGAGVYPK